MPEEGCCIKANTYEHRQWLKRRNAKELVRRTERKTAIRAARTKEIKYNTTIKTDPNYNDVEKRIEFKAPCNFSFIVSPNETIEFFNKILSFITNKFNYGKRLYIDISCINNLTIDALMYLLAIVNNMKSKIRNNFSISGNAPQDPAIRKLFTESGFYSFVEYMGTEPITKNANTIQIASGHESDNALAKHICDFVIDKSGLDRKACRFIYVMMIELMANVYKHAYNGHDLLYPRWYCFANYLKETNSIAFTFMDTGEGIPSTVRKNFAEKIDILNLKKEYKYVVSALNGDFRTATMEQHRGKGLPKIREFCVSNKIQNMRIITNKADVSILSEKYVAKDLTKPLKGTLFYWEINLAQC